MPTNTNYTTNWLSFHIYYGTDQDRMISTYFTDLLTKLEGLKILEQYFFIRYYERGPHIRLRLKCNFNKYSREEVQKIVETYFFKILLVYPSNRVDPPWINDLSKEQAWEPNNSVKLEVYIPEVERYGGIDCIGIAESHFYHSSVVTSKLIRHSLNFTNDERFSKSLYLLMAFLHSCDFDKQRVSMFTNLLIESWTLSQNKIRDQFNVYNSEYASQLLDQFRQNYIRNEISIKQTIEKIWHDISQEIVTENDVLFDWFKSSSIIHNKFKSQLIIATDKSQNLSGQNELLMKRLEGIYVSLIHMTCNRMGLMNATEGYLYYILSKGFN